ncbi:polar amino acid transport system substrate-binding protein [Kineococcus radiotolerans]|uniref:Polar amino acid transport system substrate-binding protein n=1 Tax=Kineococcus radiotolerans TaxID=131568 RepID=A0A7W4TJL4_KINRA|nr:ABC transporter substrate-binding protein [Kineococcus radiotolerans]MBB2900098.1 polar amino acid transport system substrate-binding protein [Kineococcus radiotolerans]
MLVRPPARRPFLGALGALAVLGLTAAGCGSDSLSGGTSSETTSGSASAAPSGSADAALRAMLPQSVQDSGKLRVGTNAEYAPNEFLEGSTIKGMDIDVMNAVAAKLGVTAEFSNASFDSLITGVSGNRYDAAISSFTINDERKQAVNMVQYYNAGTQWATKAGNPEGIDPEDACGKTVAVQSSTTQSDDDLPARQQACTAAGKPQIQVLAFESQQDATNALLQGRAQAMLADSPIAAYAVKQTQGLELVGDIYDAAPYGIVVPKDQTATAEAISKALQEVADDGSYAAALGTWGAEDGAVTEFPVNP